MSRSERRRAGRRLSVLSVCLIGASAGLLACDDGARPDAEPVDRGPADSAPAAPDVGPGPDADMHIARETDAAAAADAGDMGPTADAMLPPDAALEPDAAPVDPLTVPLAGQSPWGPAARVSALDVPNNADTARRAGCLLHGEGAGSKLYSLLLVAGGGLGSQVRPNPAGEIDLVVLMRAVGWEPGVSSGELDTVDIEILRGLQGPDGALLYRTDGFVDGDPEQPANTAFVGSGVDDGWLWTDQIQFELPLSLLGSPELPLRLENTVLTGRIAAEGPGFRLDDGALAGYITDEAVLELAAVLREQCLVEDAPTFCALIRSQLDEPPEVLLELVVGIIGGFEARVEGPRATPCDPEQPDDCNAVGVCLVLEGSPVIVEGAAPPP